MLFCYTGIISTGRMHLYLAFLLHRDYFHRSDASLSCFSVPQGLFPPPESSLSCSFVPQGLFCPVRMHPYLALFFHKDYFDRPDASLSCFSVPQGLFPPVGFIPDFLFCSTGIISTGQMHLYLALLFHRDYFRRPDSSLSCFFAPHGLFAPAKCISILLFCPTGMISAGRMHLYLALLLHRDYFGQPNASLL